MKKILLTIFIVSSHLLYSQTTTDALMMPKGALCTGFMFGHEKWSKYWEGDLKRENLNVGTVSTSNLMWVANYGIAQKVNVIAMLPYVWTKASGGTMTGLQGIQDLTLAAKYAFFKAPFKLSSFNTYGILSLSTPLTDYTPDYLPLSIGLGSTNISYRLNANFTMNNGWYITGSGAYTWRSNVNLDRSSYYTEGQLFMTNEVKMPNVFDYSASVGYHKGALQTELNYTQQVTLGGGDIRRQDMPFVSNRMNFSKVGALVMYYLPAPKNLAVRASGSFTVAGRNVGQSVAVAGGLLYTIQFVKPTTN